MAQDANKDKRRFVECSNFFVDYSENDVVIYDNVTDLRELFPLQPRTSLITFCTKGVIRLSANSTNYELREGDVMMCLPNLPVDRCYADPDSACQAIAVSDNIIHGLLRNMMNLWHNVQFSSKLNIAHLNEQNKKDFDNYFELIRVKLQHCELQAHYEIVLALTRAMLLDFCMLFDGINDMLPEQKLSQGRTLFNKFITLVANNDIKRRPITTYASELAITPKYLTMLCLKYSKKTASDWVIQYTVEDIRFYLRNSNLSIKEISAKLGFANMSHFGSYVRKHLGVSPSEYRERA